MARFRTSLPCSHVLFAFTGERGAGRDIGPNATLIFKASFAVFLFAFSSATFRSQVELLGIVGKDEL